MIDRSQIVSKLCSKIRDAGPDKALTILHSEYPFKKPEKTGKHQYSVNQVTKIFVRDGFIDRYSRKRLVHPGVLRLVSIIFPEDFPYHKNWKMDSCHQAYWELFPTVDHVIPVARGGTDSEDNLVCTSMLRNSAKANWTLEELGWELHPRGDIKDWDGMTRWFIDYCTENPEHLGHSYIKKWYHSLKI